MSTPTPRNCPPVVPRVVVAPEPMCAPAVDAPEESTSAVSNPAKPVIRSRDAARMKPPAPLAAETGIARSVAANSARQPHPAAPIPPAAEMRTAVSTASAAGARTAIATRRAVPAATARHARRLEALDLITAFAVTPPHNERTRKLGDFMRCRGGGCCRVLAGTWFRQCSGNRHRHGRGRT